MNQCEWMNEWTNEWMNELSNSFAITIIKWMYGLLLNKVLQDNISSKRNHFMTSWKMSTKCSFFICFCIEFHITVMNYLRMFFCISFIHQQGRIHGQYQSRMGGQGRKCVFSHFLTRSPRTDGPTDQLTDGQSLLESR